MAIYTNPRTGEQVEVSRRPSVLFAFLFIVALGLIVWFLIPRDHGWIAVHPAPTQSTTAPAPPAPAGSVSGATATPETAPPPAQPPAQP
jgi:hypothetical protein